MQISERLVQEIIPYENNPRNNDEAVDKVAESIREFGFQQPIVIDKDGVVIVGHTRLKAAKKLGLETVPVVVAEDLNEEQAKAYRLADNKTNEFAEWDIDALDIELLDIKDIDMGRFGFDLETEQPVDPEDAIEGIINEAPEPRAKRGQIWKLGRHKLMCGDSTSKTDMDELMAGEEAKFVFTDPPYGVSIGSKNKTINEIEPGRGGRIQVDIENDTKSPEELYPILVDAFSNLREHCAEDCSYYVSSPQGGELGLMMMMMMRDAGLTVRHMLIWVKNAPTFSMGRLDYDYKHEPIFYTWTKKHNFYGGFGNTVIDDTSKIEKMTKAELLEELRKIRDRDDTSVIYVNKPHQSKLHPTMKPVKLIARFMFNNSLEDDLCVDIFGGSGSTLMAAEQLKRRCNMMELDPHYCDVIIDRWESFTGKKAELING